MALSRLNDAWCQNGTKLDEFITACQEMDAHTEYVRIESPVLFSQVSADADEIAYTNGQTYEKPNFETKGLADMFAEMSVNHAPLVVVNDRPCISTNRAIAEMANLVGLHGSGFVKPSAARDAFVMERTNGVKMTAVVRTDTSANKVMSVRSDKYRSIPLSAIEDVFWGFLDNDVVGKFNVIEWGMDQDTAWLQVEFPDIGDDLRQKYPEIPEKWFPGVFFKSGTTGYTPMSVEMYYRKQSGVPVYAGRAFAKHFAAFDKDAFIKKVQNDIWGKYLQMPEKLNAFAKTRVPEAEFETVLKAVFGYVKMNKVFQKKDTETCRYLDKLWDTALTALKAIAINNDVTMYDVIDTVMELPRRVTVPAAYAELLKETCDRAWTYES